MNRIQFYFLFALIPTILHAQTRPPAGQTLPDTVVEATAPKQPVSVASRVPALDKEIPQSTQTLSRETLNERNVQSIADALELVPSATPGEGQLSAFPEFSYLIRGQTARVLRDGVRHRFFEANDANALWMIDRIEVLKGPQGVLYGFGSFGGAINLVTKAPVAEWRGELMTRGGTFGAFANGVDVGGPLNQDRSLRFRLNAEVEESDLFVHDIDLNRRNFDFQLAWDVSDALQVFTDVSYISREQTSYTGLPLFGTVEGTNELELDVRSNFGDPGYQIETAGWFFRYGTEYDIADDWTFRAIGHVHTFDQTNQTARFGARVPGTFNVARSYSATAESDVETSLDLRLNGEFDTGPIGNNAAIGVVGNAFRGGFYGDYGLTDEIVDLRGSSYGRPIPDTVRGFVIPGGRDRLDSIGVYAQDLFTLTPRWKALAGVRYDTVNHDTQFDATLFDATYSQVTWQAGTTYDLTPGLTLFGGYGTGFNPDNVLFFPRADGTSFKPETSWQVESGVKFTKEWFTGTLSGFRIVREDVVTADPSDPFGFFPSGQQTTDGLELEGQVELADGWDLGLGYALLDSTVTKDPVTPVGNRVPNVAEHSVRGFTRYVIQDGSWRGLGFSVGLNWTGDRFGTLENTYVMPSFTTLDLGVSYERDNWIAEFFLNNATDEVYFRNGGSSSVYPGEPLNLTGRFTLKF